MELVPWLDKELESLERLTAPKEPQMRHIRARELSVAYLMGDASRKEFGSALWREGTMECKSGEFSLIYQVRSSNSREAFFR